MKYVLILLAMLALPLPAQTHRGHIAEFSADAEIRLQRMETKFAYIDQNFVCPSNPAKCTTALNNLDIVRRAIPRIRQKLDAFIAVQGNGDLDDLRQQANQPRNFDRLPSLSEEIFYVSYYNSQNINLGAQPAQHMGHLSWRAAEFWVALDRMIWHINDAIREEIYVDPEFQ